MTRATLLAAVTLMGVLPQGPPAPAPGTAMITGRILSDAEAPIAAAAVTISRGGGPRNETTSVLTDAQGRFFFDQLVAGSYSITASRRGWLPGAYGRERADGASVPVVLTNGQRQSDVNIRLWRVAVITGRVVDQAGEPMVAVTVQAFRRSYPAGRQTPVFAARAQTDDRGIYRFASLAPGDYLLCVAATVTSEPSGFAAVMRAENGAPGAYMQSMTGLGTAPVVSTERAAGQTSSDRWSIASPLDLPGAPPAGGPWLTYPTTFAPSALTQSAASIVRAESGRERAGVDITLRMTPTFRVSGTVAGPDGPAAYYSVHLLNADAADAPTVDASTAVTDGSGAFTFFGVAPGSYVLRVVRTPTPAGYRLAVVGGMTGERVAMLPASPGAAPPPPQQVSSDPLLHVSQAVTVGERDLGDLALQLRAGPRLSGLVQFDGTPPGADAIARIAIVLELANAQTNSNVQPGRATATGQFATPSTWPGRYLIRAMGAPGSWRLKSAMVRGVDASETPFDLTADIDDVVLTFADASGTRAVTGTVRFDGSPARPVAAIVILFPTNPKQWVDYGRNSRLVTSAAVTLDGTYTLPAPPDGDYLIVAIPDAHASDWSNPAVLQRLAEIAETIQVRDGRATRTLPLRRLR